MSPTTPERPLLVFSFDGLTANALGCYGSPWNSTPEIDRLAANGIVWDRVIADDEDPRQVLRHWWQSPRNAREDSWQTHARRSGRIELITDVEELATAEFAGRFDHAVIVSSDSESDETEDDPDDVGEAVARTSFGKLVATLLDRSRETEQTALYWVHSGVLTKSWDAPRFLYPREEQEQELEEPGEAELEADEAWGLPEWPEDESGATEPVPWVFPDRIPPRFPLPADFDPDELMAWIRTYACQVRLIDWTIGFARQAFPHPTADILIVGTSGFALGQNGWIGHRAGPLRSCHVRLPLIASPHAPLRVPGVTAGSRLDEILASILGRKRPWVAPEPWGQPTAPLSPQVQTFCGGRPTAVSTPKWFLVEEPDSAALFVKPDDLDDVNDVSRLRDEVVAELRPVEAGPSSDEERQERESRE